MRPRCVPLRRTQVRNVLVDLDAPPRWFTRQKARRRAPTRRRCSPLTRPVLQPDCLTAAEARALAGTDGAVQLLTYAPSCGYEQNPISVY